MAVHGHVRATQDIDLLVQPEQLDLVRELVASIGYVHQGSERPFPGIQGAQLRTYRATKVSNSDHLTVDLLLADRAPFSEALENCELRELDDLDLPVVTREALIAMKRGTGRAIDQEDAERLRHGT